MVEEWVCLILFLATLTHGLSGFGLALVAVPLLQWVVSLQVATPLISLVSGMTVVAMALRYRHALEWGSLLRLAGGATVTIPLGVWAAAHWDEGWMTLILGILLVLYASYGLLGLRLPELGSPHWAWLFGGLSGFLSGMANIGGPPAIIYANCRRWDPERFKGNLQGLFLSNLGTVMLSHTLQGNYTPQVWRLLGLGLPAIVFGFLTGLWLARFVNPLQFRRLVLMSLVGIGLMLLWRSFWTPFGEG
ncbi:sulfite exporter TauE/SafE family protein [Synechococcus sp. Nb3U1]|uniref:sulfite exporter TauE/SafE family protein n=1 Tax=Synechococcus sp. Nb3U1 TaxID=1914529 RepID=UPI001F38BA10|nr:sulfite exporter TauE/SafE family protein [Synechococcus sp. Nb3U1]MCF2972327.1 sulfite exporter TauE/SafE family protein [Synechococcus sp. Nb3U1]